MNFVSLTYHSIARHPTQLPALEFQLPKFKQPLSQRVIAIKQPALIWNQTTQVFYVPMCAETLSSLIALSATVTHIHLHHPDRISIITVPMLGMVERYVQWGNRTAEGIIWQSAIRNL